jgi:hypothetical protein
MKSIPPDTTYTLTKQPTIVIRDIDGAHIPDHADNLDWQHYQAWLAAGNTPNPYAPPPPTKQQEAQAYLNGGLTIQFLSGAGSLSGTYPAVAPHTDNINALATSLSYDGNAFPLGAATAIVSDIDGVAREFDKSNFKLLTRAIRDFVYVTNLYAAGHVDALPPNETSKSIEELQEAKE